MIEVKLLQLSGSIDYNPLKKRTGDKFGIVNTCPVQKFSTGGGRDWK